MLALALGSECRKLPSFSGATPLWSQRFDFTRALSFLFLLPAGTLLIMPWTYLLYLLGLLLQMLEASPVSGLVSTASFLKSTSLASEEAGSRVKPRLVGSCGTHLGRNAFVNHVIQLVLKCSCKVFHWCRSGVLKDEISWYLMDSWADGVEVSPFPKQYLAPDWYFSGDTDVGIHEDHIVVAKTW